MAITLFLRGTRLDSILNKREHWGAKNARKNRHMTAFSNAVTGHVRPTQLPLDVTITRVAPGRGLDPTDNLPASAKNVIDAIARWLDIDDRHDHLVRYEVRQERCKRADLGVRIEIRERQPSMASATTLGTIPQRDGGVVGVARSTVRKRRGPGTTGKTLPREGDEST